MPRSNTDAVQKIKEEYKKWNGKLGHILTNPYARLFKDYADVLNYLNDIINTID